MPSGRSQSTDGESTGQQPPQATGTTNWIFDLPRQLESSIPLCANTCISSYISQDWSCSANNFTCLCSNYGSEGYTLGELAFICVSQDCRNASQDQKINAYTACTSEPNAVQATHSTLTLPTNVPTATPTNTPGTSLPHTTFNQITTSTPNPSVSAAVSESSLSIMPSVPSTSIHSPTTTAGTAGHQTSTKDSTSLTTAQAVGISVACMGGLMAALGLFYLYACIKRRKATQAKEDRQSYDFVDDAPPQISPFNHGPNDPRGPLGGFAKPRAELSSEKHRTRWPGGQNNPYQQGQEQQYHEESIDRSPDMRRSISPESPHSDCSMRTTSQLLPDKPISIRPRPLPPEGSSTPDTVFEEERVTRIPGVLMPGGGLPAHPAVLKSRQPQFTNQYTRSPEPLKHPSLSLEIPRKASGSDSLNSLGAFPLPPPRAARPPDEVRRSGERSKSRSSNNSLLNYYASPDCASDDLYSTTPIEEQSQIRRPPPTAITVTKPTYPPKAIRMSTASDTSRRTSFESTDPDDQTPPEEEDKQLTPVTELESPISGIRYPKVPRSSNQSVPRSPNYGGSPRIGISPKDGNDVRRKDLPAIIPVTPEQQRPSKHSPSPSLSGSTLAAKRRGDSAAQDLEKGLYIMTSAHSRSNSQTFAPPQHDPRPALARQNQRHESPLKGYGRVANTRRGEGEWPLSNKIQEMDTGAAMKSPLWEPKLTPRKEGEDLYLSVSAATPRVGRFHVR